MIGLNRSLPQLHSFWNSSNRKTPYADEPHQGVFLCQGVCLLCRRWKALSMICFYLFSVLYLCLQCFVPLSSVFRITVFSVSYHCLQCFVPLSSVLRTTVFSVSYLCLQWLVSLFSVVRFHLFLHIDDVSVFVLEFVLQKSE